MAEQEGFIDLGKKYEPMMTEANESKPKSKVDYPTLFVSHDMEDESGLDELPDGEFEFVGKGKVIRYTEDIKNGKCSCDIEIHAIKPSNRKAKKAKSSEDSLDEELEKIANKKKEKY